MEWKVNLYEIIRTGISIILGSVLPYAHLENLLLSSS